jgi:hypothetical protein
VGIQLGQGSLKADVRYSFTATFLHAAAIFVRYADEIESIASVELDADKITEHRGYVLAAVMHSVAALEAEIFEVSTHGPGHHLGSNHIDAAAQLFLAPLEDLIDDQEVLQRYALVLHLLAKQPIPRDEKLWEHASLLVKLRNALVHYKSRWGREMDTTKFLASLKKLGLPRPSFVSAYENAFPQRYLSAACAAWAVQTSIAFLLEFYARLGFPAPVAHIEAKVQSLLTKCRNVK